MSPQLVVLTGPNGAGKSTFYAAFLRESPLPFLNADAFAAETGLDAFVAARVLDATRDRMIEEGLGFITETVFSDPHGHKLGMLRRALDAGYDVTLIYIGVTGTRRLIQRVEARIAQGGHDVPRDRIGPRFERSLANLAAAIRFVPTVKLYDNSSAAEPYRLLVTFDRGVPSVMVRPLPKWANRVVGPTPRT
jgi:predicted ABC-type ATPase